MTKLHHVQLSQDNRLYLEHLIGCGSATARELLHARILLKADEAEHGPAWTDAAIAQALDCAKITVERVRKNFATAGLEAALRRKKPNRVYARKLDGRGEAHLIALACSEAPEGYDRWSLRLLSERFVELGYAESLSHESVRQVLKKTNSSRTVSSSG